MERLLGKEEARLVLPFTSSVELAQRALRHLPVGGKTPLPAGLMLAYRVFRREIRLSPEAMPLLILLTDGAGNVSLTELPPQEVLERKLLDAIHLARERLARQAQDQLPIPRLPTPETPPPAKRLLAALTRASTCCCVISPSTSSSTRKRFPSCSSKA